MNDLKLEPAFKAKWVSALRSGTYKQTQGNLRRGDAYCCLGVGAVCRGEKVPEGDSEDTDSIYNYFYTHIGRTAKETLIEMNDDEKRSFDEIAAWIDTNL